MKRAIFGAALFCALASSAFGYTYPVKAGAATPTPPAALNCDLLHLAPGCGGIGSAIISQGISSIFGQFSSLINSDFAAALALSTAVPGLQDYNGAECWQQLQTVGAVLKAHPVPATLQVATDFEALRLAQGAVNKLCQSSACGMVFSDAAAIGTAASGLPIPSLTALCAKIPTVSLGTAPPVITAPAIPASPAPN